MLLIDLNTYPISCSFDKQQNNTRSEDSTAPSVLHAGSGKQTQLWALMARPQQCLHCHPAHLQPPRTGLSQEMELHPILRAGKTQ